MQQKKKILVFIPTFPVLSETFIERELAKLAERGNVDVHIVSLAAGAGVLSPSLRGKVFYERLSWKDSFFASKYIFKRFSAVLKIWRDLGDEERGFISKLYLFLKSIGYVEVFAKHQPDFILAHFMSEPSTICYIVSGILDLPFGISAHAKDVTVEAEYVRQKVNRAKFILICNKNALKHTILLSGVSDPDNVYLQYHGIDFEKMKQQFDNALLEDLTKPSVPVLTMVGRLVEKKGHEYLLSASKILKDRGVAHKLYIIGPGPLYAEIMKKIHNYGLQDTAEILGGGKGMSFDQILKYYRLTDVCVFSGIKTDSGDEDGLPNILTEAAVLRIPIVTTDVGSTTDLVENGVSGLVVPQRDAQALADALERMIKDRDLSQKLAEGADMQVRKIFDLDKNVEEIERLLL